MKKYTHGIKISRKIDFSRHSGSNGEGRGEGGWTKVSIKEKRERELSKINGYLISVRRNLRNIYDLLNGIVTKFGKRGNRKETNDFDKDEIRTIQ